MEAKVSNFYNMVMMITTFNFFSKKSIQYQSVKYKCNYLTANKLGLQNRI